MTLIMNPMKYKYNSQFESYGGVSLLSERQHDCSTLLKYDIVITDDCYFHGFLPKNSYSPDLQSRTDSERFHNKIQIDGSTKFSYAVQYAIELSGKLGALNQGTFNVILSYDGETCAITFHKHREEEIHDLTSQEGVLVVTNL